MGEILATGRPAAIISVIISVDADGGENGSPASAFEACSSTALFDLFNVASNRTANIPRFREVSSTNLTVEGIYEGWEGKMLSKLRWKEEKRKKERLDCGQQAIVDRRYWFLASNTKGRLNWAIVQVSKIIAWVEWWDYELWVFNAFVNRGCFEYRMVEIDRVLGFKYGEMCLDNSINENILLFVQMEYVYIYIYYNILI